MDIDFNTAHTFSSEEENRWAVCDHGLVFDYEIAKCMTSDEVRKKFPRLGGVCPRGCGYNGIAYVSFEHYICGDW